MNIFKDFGIILRVKHIVGQDPLYTIFLKNYGITYMVKKKRVREKALDSGHIIHCEITTKAGRDIHSFSNVSIKGYIDSEQCRYEKIELCLVIFSYVYKNLPHGNPHQNIFDTLEILINSFESLTPQKITLLGVKVIALAGNLPENHKDMTVKKILRFIHNSPPHTIVLLGEYPQETQKYLKEILLS